MTDSLSVCGVAALDRLSLRLILGAVRWMTACWVHVGCVCCMGPPHDVYRFCGGMYTESAERRTPAENIEVLNRRTAT